MEFQRTLRVATIDHITPEPNEIDIAVHSSRHLMRDKFKSYLLSNLKTVCEKKNWPFYEICRPDYQVNTVIGIKNSSPNLILRQGRPHIFCGLVKDATLFGISGYLIVDDSIAVVYGLGYSNYPERIINQLGAFLKGVDEPSSVFLDIGPPEMEVNEEAVYLGGHQNFGHFLTQFASRIPIYDRFDQLNHLPVLIYDGLPDRYYDFIELFGIEKSRFILIPENSPVKVKKLWMAPPAMYRGHYNDFITFIWKESVFSLRSKVMKNFSLPQKTERVYLKRDPSRYRNIANIQEIEELLKSFDFNFYRMEKYPAKKQIEIISQASLLVTVAGPDANASMFASDDCFVIDLNTEMADGPLGSGIGAFVFGHRYHRIDGPAVDTDPIGLEKIAPPSGREALDRNYYIAPDVLRKALSDSITLMDKKQSMKNGNEKFWESISNWGTEFEFRAQFASSSQIGTVKIKSQVENG